MSLLAKDSGGTDFTPVSEDVHHGICIWVYDLGIQVFDSVLYGRTESHKVLLTFEIPDETIVVEGETRPRVISKEYTLSLGKKANLRKDLTSWRGKEFTEKELEGFDIQKLLGVNCLIQVVHTHKGEKVYANIASIMALPKSMPRREPFNRAHSYILGDSFPEEMPEWIKNKIMKALNYNNKPVDREKEESALSDDDEIPF